MKKSIIPLLAVLICSGTAFAQQAAIVKNDAKIDGLDPGIKIFFREKMAQGNTRFANDNVVLFLHGQPAPRPAILISNTRIIPGRTGS